MKTNKLLILFVLSIPAIAISCKKSNDVNSPGSGTIGDSSQVSRTIADSIKNKNWWGTFSYSGKTPEYYSIEFNADSSLVWEQESGDTKGHWSLTGKKITITFEGNDMKITADILGDRLSNLSDNTSKSEILTGQMIANPNNDISNTSWKGSAINGQKFKFSFMNDNTVNAYDEAGNSTTILYKRYPNSGVIRFENYLKTFAIVISAHEMVGSIIEGNTFRISKVE